MEQRWIARILDRDLETLRREVEAAPDDPTLWATPPGIGNSIGTLALHIAGNIQHFIGAVLGQDGFQRQRDLEFSARGVPRADLVAGLEQARAVVRRVFSRPIDLSAEYPETIAGTFRVTTGDWLIHLAVHLGYHVGQAGYLRRMLTQSPKPVPAVSVTALASARKVAG